VVSTKKFAEPRNRKKEVVQHAADKPSAAVRAS
jgi:hypothetical protein